jgi:regulator of sigma E protease
VSLLYLVFAILGLGFLIFIHELGHYWMARRVGMRVESFGIGFGKPIITFIRDGVKWNICWLPFGGYVKIAGMEKEDGKDPEEIRDGFFGKSPIDRMKVAIMGPLANIVFAFLLFCFIWVTGGRQKNYADITQKVGWVDPRSELFQKGVRPGDVILKYDDEEVKGPKDHFRAAMTSKGMVQVTGLHWNNAQNAYEPFDITIKPYPHPQALEQGVLTTGVLAPASFIIYPQRASLPKGSPLETSGIERGDRIVWLDGEEIYSLPQLSFVLNDNRAILTVLRGGKTLLCRVSRLPLEELKLSREIKDELSDWQWEANLISTKFSRLFFIPYALTADCKVESSIPLASGSKVLPDDKQFLRDVLLPGDEIIAVDGHRVTSGFGALALLQKHKLLIVVQRGVGSLSSVDWKDADYYFDEGLHSKDLSLIVGTLGTAHSIRHKGNLELLNPVEPKRRSELFQSQEMADKLASELEEEKKHIEAIDDPEKRSAAIKYFENRGKQLLLGLPGVQDVAVRYNPTPVVMFEEIFDEIVHTLSALVGGYLNPKWLSGPIGIVQVIHHQWVAGIKEVIFWIAVISLNLGLLNLLPLPVLDGGYICLSLFEILSGKKLKPKTVEKIVVPFAVLLISFFVYLTYHDILRLLGSLVKW